VTDDNLEEVYVNKYGVLKPFSEVEDLLVNRKTQKFALDDLTDVRTSVPATVVGSKLPNDLTADQGFNFSTSAYTAADLRNFMTVDIDDSGNPVTVDLSSFKSENRNITGVELAQFIQNQLNVKFGDDRYFDLTTTSSQTFTVNYADTSGTTTVDVDLGTTFNTEQLQRTATVDAVVEDIQSQIDATLTNGEVTVSYDFASRTFRFMPSSSSDTVSLSSASTNNLFKTTPTPSAVDSDGLYGETITPNGELIRAASEQRFGMGVSYDGAQQTFSFSSGTTGDTSQIALNFSVPEYDTTSGDQLLDNDGNLTGTLTAQVDFATFMGFEVTGTTDSQYSELPSDEAIRGVVSLPAITRGSSIAVNVNNNFSVDASNNTFVVSVNDVKGTLVLPTSSGYTLDSFIIELEKGINQLASDSGSTVSGVTVEYDPDSNGLVFTTGTTGTDSFIKVSGSATWGMANIESGRGTTTTWIKPRQSADIVNNVAVNKYIDEFGNETASADGFSTLPEWSPIFLDKGELTFDTSGNLVSPTGGAQLDTVFLAGGRGALNLNIDYTGTTQFSQAFAVKSQSQDGSPEGDLVGVDIGDDGLVVASYSNGSQESLGKIVLVTFPSNEGLRQNGDSSYLSSAKSGAATFGEAGTAGFGTIRAGARERSNVDLTTELVGLITAQRNFQANAKAIETSSALTSAIINIRS
jgi:flagellar hook-basal body protein